MSHGYVYDPSDPVRIPNDVDSHYQLAKLAEPPTGADLERSELEARADVLVYETPPLEHELVIAGRGWVDLHAESDCVDTDWFVWLADHRPDGRSILLAQGRLGARFRNGLEYPELLVPGEVYRYRIELTEVAYAFPRGHRIALAVTSSSFPAFARNPNTGEPIATAVEWRAAYNQIHLGRRHPSQLQLPVLDSDRETP